MDIILKHSNQTDLIPKASELSYGELAVNYAAGKEYVYLRNDDDEIVSIPITKIVEIDGIITESTVISASTYFNKIKNRIETYEPSQGFPKLDKTYNLSVGDILYDKYTASFYIWDGTNDLKKLDTDIQFATTTTAGIVKGGGNVDIDANGVMSVNLSDYATNASVNSLRNELGNIDSILHCHRMDWLEVNTEWTMYRYSSLRSAVMNILSYNNDIRVFVKNATTASYASLDSTDNKTITMVYLIATPTAITKEVYTITPDTNYRPGEIIPSDTTRMCTVVKTTSTV